MKKVKCVQKTALKSGWTRWNEPIMQGYLMQCCDCGLIHQMEFRVLKRAKKTKSKNGYWKAEEMPSDKYRISMRAKRIEDHIEYTPSLLEKMEKSAKMPVGYKD